MCARAWIAVSDGLVWDCLLLAVAVISYCLFLEIFLPVHCTIPFCITADLVQ